MGPAGSVGFRPILLALKEYRRLEGNGDKLQAVGDAGSAPMPVSSAGTSSLGADAAPPNTPGVN